MLGSMNPNPFNKCVRFVLTNIIEYSRVNTIRTLHTNMNYHPNSPPLLLLYCTLPVNTFFFPIEERTFNYINQTNEKLVKTTKSKSGGTNSI